MLALLVLVQTNAALWAHMVTTTDSGQSVVAIGLRDMIAMQVDPNPNPNPKTLTLPLPLPLPLPLTLPLPLPLPLSLTWHTRPCRRIAAPDSRDGHGPLRIHRLPGVQTDDGGQEKVITLLLLLVPHSFVFGESGLCCVLYEVSMAHVLLYF